MAWIAERKNCLSCFFALGSLLAYLQFVPPDLPAGESATLSRRALRGRWYALAFALYVAALLSKTVTISLPAVILVILWWKRGRLTRGDCLRLAPFFAVGAALSCLTVYMEKTYVGASGDEWKISFLARCLIAGRASSFMPESCSGRRRYATTIRVGTSTRGSGGSTCTLPRPWPRSRRCGWRNADWAWRPLAVAIIFVVVLFPGARLL